MIWISPQKIPGSSLVVALRSWWIDLERKSSCSTQRGFGLCCSTSVWSPRCVWLLANGGITVEIQNTINFPGNWTASLPLNFKPGPKRKGVFQASFFRGYVKFQGCTKTAKKSRWWILCLHVENHEGTWYFLWKGISLILEGPHFYFYEEHSFWSKDMATSETTDWLSMKYI